MAILRKLNVNGVDAMIVSPFRIPVDFGAKLALDFTNLVRSNREHHNTPTLMELFIEASKSTSQYFKDRGDKRMQDMALEFVIVGDPNLKLCDH